MKITFVYMILLISYYIYKEQKRKVNELQRDLILHIHKLGSNRHPYKKHLLKQEWSGMEDEQEVHQAIDDGLFFTIDDMMNDETCIKYVMSIGDLERSKKWVLILGGVGAILIALL